VKTVENIFCFSLLGTFLMMLGGVLGHQVLLGLACLLGLLIALVAHRAGVSRFLTAGTGLLTAIGLVLGSLLPFPANDLPLLPAIPWNVVLSLGLVLPRAAEIVSEINRDLSATSEDTPQPASESS